MRLRRKPWIDEAILEYQDFVYQSGQEEYRGYWSAQFSDTGSLHVELGTGKGDFIAGMAALYPDVHYIGIEVQLGVLYYAAKKVATKNLTNVKLLEFDIEALETIFAEGEVDRFYINFCDPWPKARHSKRRLTHRNFLDKYRRLLKAGGQIHFKTDNADLFAFSLEEFRECGWTLTEVAYDLHNSGMENNVMTEYERKFSMKGQPIFRCVATSPDEVQ